MTNLNYIEDFLKTKCPPFLCCFYNFLCFKLVSKQTMYSLVCLSLMFQVCQEDTVIVCLCSFEGVHTVVWIRTSGTVEIQIFAFSICHNTVVDIDQIQSIFCFNCEIV